MRHAVIAAALTLFAGMVRIPAGTFQPLYATVGDGPVHVAAFALDQNAVTRGEYLTFVRTHAEWRRGNISAVFADQAYLSDWRAPLDAGDADLARPVTWVSWFAASAYCEAQGKRLPTTNEWEYAAAASENRRDATRDADFIQRLLTLYVSRSAAGAAGFRNVYGVAGMHGSVWEWTHDFNSVLASDDSRESGSSTAQRDHRAFCATSAIGAVDPANYPAFMRYAFRASLTGRSTTGGLGLRCAASAPAS